MDQFTYIRQNDGTRGPRLLGQILLASGIFVILVPLFVDLDTDPLKLALVGGGAVLFGIILSSIKSRIVFAFERKLYKESHSILWFKSGEWEPLPEIDHAELIHHSFRTSYTPNGITPTLNGQVTLYKIVLLANGAKFLVLDFNREKDAVVALEKIKSALEVRHIRISENE
mgnify:FL=1